MNAKPLTLYYIHTIISRFGSKISSMVIALYFIALYPDQSLTYNLILFAMGALPAVLLTPIYAYFIRGIKDWRWMAALDLLSGLCILATFFLLENIYWVFVLQLLLVMINDLVSRLDEGMFFVLSNRSENVVRAIRINGSITSALSMFAPSLSTFLIALIGYSRSLLINFGTYSLSSILYLCICVMIGVKWTVDTSSEDSAPSANRKSVNIFSDKSHWELMIAYLVVVFITNLETPLSLDYFSIIRNFSEQQIGIIMGMFSLGMIGGSYAFKFIPTIDLNTIFAYMILDGTFSILLVLNTTIWGVILFYTLQGIFAMFMVLTFRVVIQQLFSNSKEYVVFQTHFTQYKSLVLIFAYLLFMLISLYIHNSRLILAALALLEIASAALIKVFSASAHKQS